MKQLFNLNEKGTVTSGSVLAGATTLPVTAAGVLLLGNANSLIIWGLLAISLINLAITLTMVSRYAVNTKRTSKK